MNRRDFGARMLALGGLALFAAPSLLRATARPRMVNEERLIRDLFALARFGSNPQGGVSRVAYSDADLAGRAHVRGLMERAALRVSVDAAGNLIGRREGSDPRLLPLAFGSHIDSVPDGGNYDGPVGSLAAVEAIRVMEERGIRTRHPLEVLIFANEEGGKTGSRVLSGEFEDREITLPTASGHTIGEGTRRIGGAPERFSAVRREAPAHAAFLELHIEQGGTLEAMGMDIGVVEGIVGIRRWEVAVEGFANHAGTTPMDQRRDALLSAARFVQAVHEETRSMPGSQVATVGRIAAEPGAPNVIPGRATLSLEIRDLAPARVEELFEKLRGAAERIGDAEGTTFHFTPIYSSAAALADPGVQEAIAGVAAELGLSTRRMPSGAGHDAQSMAALGPMGMIFVPSVGGISHSPREFSHPHDVVNGAEVLLRTLLRLDASLGG